MLKILQSINYSTTKDKCFYEPNTPLRRNKIFAQNELNTPNNGKKDDMKSVSRNKERFHSSIKDRKSQSAFHYSNGFGGIDN
jgi:hypothetical protein